MSPSGNLVPQIPLSNPCATRGARPGSWSAGTRSGPRNVTSVPGLGQSSPLLPQRRALLPLTLVSIQSESPACIEAGIMGSRMVPSSYDPFCSGTQQPAWEGPVALGSAHKQDGAASPAAPTVSAQGVCRPLALTVPWGSSLPLHMGRYPPRPGSLWLQPVAPARGFAPWQAGAHRPCHSLVPSSAPEERPWAEPWLARRELFVLTAR